VFYIVEQESKLSQLQSLGSLGLYVDVISSNSMYHPKLTSTVAVYIRPVNGDTGYIIPINHDEGVNVAKERVYEVLSAASKLYTLDKKNLLYHFNLQNTIDLSLLYSMTYYDRLEYSRENNSLNFFYNKFSGFANINQLIPISKLYESCEKTYESIRKYVGLEIPRGFEFYNTTATNIFFLIEQSGLGIFYEPFNKLFTPRNPLYNIKDNVTFTSYNLYNATSRPTNAFNSVNYAAIPKTAEHRKCFRPQNDYFVELDFDGYHLRLLCDQIDYELTSESAHKQLARLYFEKEEVTDEEYAQAKQINFQAIYGKIPEQHAFLKIFEEIQEYITTMWNFYEENGEVYNPMSGKAFTKELKDMHPQKLMNYMMQSLETSRNILILKEVLRYLKNKKTKIALYTYDAILFDFSKEDGKSTLEDIQKIMEEGGKYPIKFKYSKDLVLD
jgi:hypothetical protein